ncbi:hypothetical protein PENSPDRAFT_752643 [Peniophora sp. CONT]|nr:hypothetical protein PENSPDRAFT_752643 [Peniophora sp. CONT]
MSGEKIETDARDAALRYWQAAFDTRLLSLPTAPSFPSEEALDISHDSEVAAIQAVLSEVQVHRQCQRRTWREQRNARLSATRYLPPELLGHIFMHLADISRETSQAHRLSSRWIHVSHVCRHWRAIALNTSALWSEISTSMPRPCWDTFLARSRSSLLTVRSKWRSAGHLRRGDVLAIFHRIRHLDIKVHRNTINDFDVAFEQLAPHLRTMKIEGPEHDDNWDPVLDEFIAHRAPSLQKLYLGLIPFPWGVHLTNLISLELSTLDTEYHPEDMSIRTFEHVLDTLRAAHNLETLILDGDNHFEPPPQQLPVPTISSHLRRVSLTGSTSRVGLLLAAIKANTTLNTELISDELHDATEQEVDPEDVEDDWTDSAFASRVLHNHLTSRGSGGPAEFTAFHLVFKGACIALQLGFEVVLSPQLYSAKDTQREQQPAVSIRLSLHGPHRHAATSIRAKTLKLARGIPHAQLECIRHLTLSALCWKEDDVTAFFSRTSLVETLTVDSLVDTFVRDAASLLVHLLCTATVTPDEASSTSGQPRFLPALKSVHIIGISFQTPVQCNGQGVTLDAAITSGLTMRKRSGQRGLIFKFERCRDLPSSTIDIWTGDKWRIESLTDRK